MPWKETSKGVFERPLGENESFMNLVRLPGLPLGHEHWAISSQASFTPKGRLGPSKRSKDDLKNIFQQAWKLLRFQQPSIASDIVESEEKFRYEVPSAETLQAWVDETFVTASPGSTPDELIATRKPTGLAVLTYFPHLSQFVLQTSHWRTDGIGVFQILDNYFDLICQYAAGTTSLPTFTSESPSTPSSSTNSTSTSSSPPHTQEPEANAKSTSTWGSEPARLAPSVEEAANCSHEQSPELISIAEQAVGTFALTAGAVGVAYTGDETTLPAGTRVKHIQLSEEESSAVIAGCKAHTVSVTSAVHASVAAANYAFSSASSSSADHYTSTVRYGLRPYLPAPYNTRAYGSGLYTSGYMFSMPGGQTWSENARAANTEYRKGYGAIMPAHRQYARLLGDAIRATPPPETPPSDMDVSSVGVVEKFVASEYGAGGDGDGDGDGDLEITHVTLGTEMLTRQMVCFVWTFRGRLNLQIVYNEAYHTGEQVDKLLQFVKTTTTRELRVGG